MILALTLLVAATAGLVLCWLSARHDDRKAPYVRPPASPGHPRSHHRAVNQ